MLHIAADVLNDDRGSFVTTYIRVRIPGWLGRRLYRWMHRRLSRRGA